MPDVLILPHLSPDADDLAAIARGLAGMAWPQRDVVALFLPLDEAGCVAVQFRSGGGARIEVDLDAVGRHMSTGGHGVGVAHGGAAERGRAWVQWKDGREVARFGPADELLLPVDEDGFPELDETPRRRGEGAPEGWDVFRSCHDLGMQAAFSCRFRPVAFRVARLDGRDGDGESGARAFVLVRDGQALHPPLPMPWPPTPPTAP